MQWCDKPESGAGYYFCYEPPSPRKANWAKNIAFVDGQLVFYSKGHVCTLSDFPDGTKWCKVDMPGIT